MMYVVDQLSSICLQCVDALVRNTFPHERERERAPTFFLVWAKGVGPQGATWHGEENCRHTRGSHHEAR